MNKYKHMDKLKLVIICTTITLLASGLFAYYYSSKSHVQYQPATSSQKKAGEQSKEEFLNNDTTADEAEVSKDNETTVANDARVIITEAAQQSDDKSLRVGAIVQSVNGSNGACSLLLTKGEVRIRQENTALAQSNYMACPDFVVSRSQLSPGTWTLVIKYSDSAKNGETTREVEIN